MSEQKDFLNAALDKLDTAMSESGTPILPGPPKGPIKHGHSRSNWKSRTYVIWQCMKQRCFDPKNKYYHRYGGRGITVCDKWRNDFSAFLADMGEAPKGLTVDRINNDGNYEPSNCRWATNAEQQLNHSRVKLLTHGGETMCVAAWARKLGIHVHTMQDRINRKLPEEKIFCIGRLPKAGRCSRREI